MTTGPGCSPKRRKPRSSKPQDSRRGSHKVTQDTVSRPGKITNREVEERAKEKAARPPPHGRPREGARMLSPPQHPGLTLKVEPTLPLTNLGLQSAMEENVSQAHRCQWEGVRQHIHNWEQLTSDKILLQAIKRGVKAPMNTFPHKHLPRECPVSEEITATIGEYSSTCAIRKLTHQEEQRTHFWVPVFGREKRGLQKSASSQT